MGFLLTKDDAGNVVQVIGLPATGATTDLASAVGSAATAGTLNGLYRITTTIDARICAGATAVATDMMMLAGTTEYLRINNAKLAAYCAATGGTISATLIG
jgi:hypothetical protein